MDWKEDDRSLEVNKQDFRGCQSRGYVISRCGTQLGVGLATLSTRNWQIRGDGEKKPVIRYVHVFDGAEVTSELAGRMKPVRWGNSGKRWTRVG